MRSVTVSLVFSGAMLFATGEVVQAEAFRAGAAQMEITPPVGYRRAGGYDEDISQSVVDPLFAKALVFEQGTARAALVVCDLCSIARQVSDPVRKRASQRSGIPVENITICMTHTHGGPEYSNIVGPAGPVDEELPMVLFRNAQTDQPVASLTAFAMHVATFGDGKSFGADFPGVLQAKLREQFGPEFILEAWRTLNTHTLRARDGATLRDEVQAFQLGEDLALVTLPHEVSSAPQHSGAKR